MYNWTEPYEDEYIKERIEELQPAQRIAHDHGSILVSSYEQFWLPFLNQMPDTEYIGRLINRWTNQRGAVRSVCGRSRQAAQNQISLF